MNESLTAQEWAKAIEDEYNKELSHSGPAYLPLTEPTDLEIRERLEDFERDIKLTRYYQRLVEGMRKNPSAFIY